MITTNEAVIHVYFGGRSYDVSIGALEISARSSDGQIRSALARHLEVNVSRLADYVIDRHANGNMTIRPEAVFG